MNDAGTKVSEALDHSGEMFTEDLNPKYLLHLSLPAV